MLQFEKQHSRKEYVRGLKTPNFPRARLFNLSAKQAKKETVKGSFSLSCECV